MIVLSLINSFGTETAKIRGTPGKKQSCWSPGDCVLEGSWGISTTFVISELKIQGNFASKHIDQTNVAWYFAKVMNGHAIVCDVLFLKTSTTQTCPRILQKSTNTQPLCDVFVYKRHQPLKGCLVFCKNINEHAIALWCWHFICAWTTHPRLIFHSTTSENTKLLMLYQSH